MPTELSVKLQNIMAREMGHMGKFIIKKQCADLNIDPDNIQPEHIDTLANAFLKAVVMFTGQEKAKALQEEIKRLK